MSIFSKVNNVWDNVRSKIDDLGDSIYGVMPSPVQNAVDAVGKPIAGVVNSVANKVDNSIPESVQALIKLGLTPYAALVLGSTAAAPVAIPAALGAGPAAAGAAGVAAAGSSSAVAGAGLGSAVGTGLASGIGSGLGSAISGILPAAAGYAGAIDYNQTMRDTNRETNQTNMAIANQNLGFQRELQDYNKNLQQTIFNREDSSYQRTVNDMRAAGMSPLAMNGTNGAGEAIALGAMNNQYQHTPLSNYKSPLDALAQINPLGVLGQIVNLQSSIEDLQSKRLQNNLASDTYDYNKAKIKAESLLSQYNQMDSSRREKFNSAFNLNSSMSEKEKFAQIISKLIGTPLINKDGSPNMNLGSDLDKLLNKLSGSSPVKAAIDSLSSSSKSTSTNKKLQSAPRAQSSKVEPNWREKRGSTWVKNR